MGKEILKRTTMEKAAALFGAGAGGAAASAAGSTVVSAFGISIVAATPVGWVIAGTVAGGAALYGISKTIGGKGSSDGQTKVYKETAFENKKAADRVKKASESQNDINIAKALLDRLPSDCQEYIKEMNENLDNGLQTPEEVINMCNEILDIKDVPIETLDDEVILQRSLIILYKHLITIDGKTSKIEMNFYSSIMKKDYNLSKKSANKIFSDAPNIENINELLTTIKKIMSVDNLNLLVKRLVSLAEADGLDDRELKVINTIKSNLL